MRNYLLAISITLLLFTSLSFAVTRQQIEFPVEKINLDNGLTVLIYENHSSPIISYQQWFRVGSSHEKPGRTGLAHFFEHLMFKGTEKYPKGEIDRIIQMNGGTKNAFTTEDYTGYYTNLPSDKLELIIDIESDRMKNLIFDEREINSEREVVKEERRMRYDNSIYGSLFLLIRSTLYKTGPYRWPVIGYMSDLNATKMDELKEFYKSYYAPNNAVVVVAGDVKASRVKSLIKKYYGSISKQVLPPFEPTPEVEQKSPRQGVLEKDVQGATLAVVYPGVPAGHPDAYALDFVSAALGSGASSRLYKRLVYSSQLATSASSSNSNDKLAGELAFYFTLRPGVKAESALSLVNQELHKIKNQPISDEELAKLKNQLLLSYVNGLETIAARANALAASEIIFGDYKKMFDDLDRYAAIKKEDVLAAAKKYIVPNKRNFVQILPKSNTGADQ